MRAEPSGDLTVGDRQLAIRHLDRVVFPRTGTTKAEVLDYYVRVSAAMLPHLADRLLHMHRYPEGVEGPRFWQKECPPSRPDWVQTAAVWSPAKQASINYCVIDDLAGVLWAVNLGSIELHTSLHRRQDLHRPTALAFDLDPGAGVDVLACGAVALLLRRLLDALGLASVVKTSGSKGLQVYAPLNTAVTYADTKPLARAIAEGLADRQPDRIVARMPKALRAGRVLIDWSQNTEHKSMVCPYSVRAKAAPTVSTPVLWDEVRSAVRAGDAQRLVFDIATVPDRVERHGDLFADVLTREQALGRSLR